MELDTETGEKWSWESNKIGPCSGCPAAFGRSLKIDFFFLIPLYKRNKNYVSLLLVGEKPSLSGITPKGFSGAECVRIVLCKGAGSGSQLRAHFCYKNSGSQEIVVSEDL